MRLRNVTFAKWLRSHGGKDLGERQLSYALASAVLLVWRRNLNLFVPHTYIEVAQVQVESGDDETNARQMLIEDARIKTALGSSCQPASAGTTMKAIAF
jgi:hypothetical protein